MSSILSIFTGAKQSRKVYPYSSPKKSGVTLRATSPKKNNSPMTLIDKYVAAKDKVSDLEHDLKLAKKFNKPEMPSKQYKEKKARIRAEIASTKEDVEKFKQRLVNIGEDPSMYGGGKRGITRRANRRANRH